MEVSIPLKDDQCNQTVFITIFIGLSLVVTVIIVIYMRQHQSWTAPMYLLESLVRIYLQYIIQSGFSALGSYLGVENFSSDQRRLIVTLARLALFWSSLPFFFQLWNQVSTHIYELGN